MHTQLASLNPERDCAIFCRSSIHVRVLHKTDLRQAHKGFPIPVEGCPGVYHCGFHSEKSFSAASYLVVRPAGNIMVDCPRYNPVLARQLEDLGGVQHILLSHMYVSPTSCLFAKSCMLQAQGSLELAMIM